MRSGFNLRTWFRPSGPDREKSRYRAMVRRQFMRNRRAAFSLYILYALLFIFVFADFIANDQPVIAKYEGTWRMPVVKQYLVDLGWDKWPEELGQVSWHKLEYDFVLFPLIPYSPDGHDIHNADKSPFENQQIQSMRWRHWMGTDGLGRDLFSAMIHATRIDLSIGIIAMGVAAFIGILLGALAGFFGDNRMRISRIRFILLLVFLLMGLFYAFSARQYALTDSFEAGILPTIGQFLLSMLILLGFILAGLLLSKGFEKAGILTGTFRLPLDIFVSRLIEVVVSVPVIFLIIMILAIIEGGSIFWVMVVIGLTRWTGIARFIRAELLRIRRLEYIESAYALGYGQFRILWRHAIPNSLAPVFVAIAFGIASSILIEAFLSFVGLGVPPDVPSWGSLLNQGRQDPRDWWMALFPGLAIFLTVTVFNLIGEGLSDALDPKQKQ